MEKFRVAIVGCGDIARPYALTIKEHDFLKIAGAYDLDSQRSTGLVQEFGGNCYPTLNAVLADPDVDLIVNLTTQKAHAEIVRACLESGKHVHTEKPLAMSYEEAASLAKLARDKGLRLSCSPITFMGEAEQTAWKMIRSGATGPIRVIYAEVNWHRLETWHPNPEPFYSVGAHYDVAVYPLSIITAFFGPAIRVTTYGKMLLPQREMPDHRTFHISTPDFMVSMIELANGALVRLTSNFYVSWETKQRGIEFHGDAGSLYISSWERFHAAVEFAPFGEDYTPVPYVRTPYNGIEWARALTETHSAIQENRPHRSSAEHAAHIIEILNAMDTSIQLEKSVELHSTFTPPAPMEWAI